MFGKKKEEAMSVREKIERTMFSGIPLHLSPAEAEDILATYDDAKFFESMSDSMKERADALAKENADLRKRLDSWVSLAGLNPFTRGAVKHVFTQVRNAVHQNAQDKGFYDEHRHFSDHIALIHSEVSELLEAYRKRPLDIDAMEEELADVIIRCLDMAGHYKMDIGGAVVKKHEKNKTRDYRHGGKAL